MSSGGQDFLKLFLEDAEEQLDVLNRMLLGMEKGANDKSSLDELFRAAHSLKGAAASMEFTGMAALTHEMENIFDEMRKCNLPVSHELADCLFLSLDMLEHMLRLVAAGGSDNIDIAPVYDKLRAFLAAPASEPIPAEAVISDDRSETAIILPQLSDYEHAIVREKLESGSSVYETIIYMADASVMRDVRALIILNKLKTVAEVIKCRPDLDQLDDADNYKDFHFLIATCEPREIILGMLEDGDVERAALIPAESRVKTENTDPSASETTDSEPPPQTAAAEPGSGIVKKADRAGGSATIRVETGRLDEMMNLIGELVINRTRFAQLKNDMMAAGDENNEPAAAGDAAIGLLQKIKNLNSEFDLCYQHMGRITSELQERVMRMRMLPISNVFNRFERVVRDLARRMDRDVRLKIAGQETELDKTVIELIGDPLMHIVRNAIAHGIEPAAERAAAGKPEEGLLALRAFHEGNQVVIEIEDDGRGINPERIKETALRTGLISAERAKIMTDSEAINMIFRPGFSTSVSADSVSGRGVGMDVVARNIEQINGMIDVKTQIGRGSKFTIRIPLTLAIIQALLVDVSGDTFAIPLANIVEAIRIRPEEIDTIEGREVAVIRGSVLSLLRMDEVLGLPPAEEEQRFIYVVVVGLAEKRMGLVIHQLKGRQEIVVKAIGDEFKDVPAISGASILSNGNVSLILDVGSLVDMGVKNVNTAIDNRRLEAAAAGR
ncbi:MAG: chemotaxis protein CheA [bacterium]